MAVVEDAINVLRNNHNDTILFQKSVSDSMKKISETFAEYQKFQIKTELYRQQDTESRNRVEKKVDQMSAKLDDELGIIHGRIRKERDVRISLDTEFKLLKQKIETNKEFDDKNEARAAKHSDKWWGLGIGALIAAIGAYFSSKL